MHSFCYRPPHNLAGGRGVFRNGIPNSHPYIIHQASSADSRYRLYYPESMTMTRTSDIVSVFFLSR
jgi:hypothetical protein